MTIAEMVLEKLQQLPEETQRCVLDFVGQLQTTSGPPSGQPFDPYGCCADLRTDLPFEEFEKTRKEMCSQGAKRDMA